MNDFSFSSVPDVRIGIGSSSELGACARNLSIKHVLLVTDAEILGLGLLDSALASLKKSGIAATVFSEVVADPAESVVLAGLEFAQGAGCDGVIGFGGGSSLDVAKLLAVLILGNQSLSEIYGVDQIDGARLPLIQVPTTAGTGSEATMVSIITTGKTTKAGVVSRVLLADNIILDASLTEGLPAHVTAATGIDAMVHAIEAFTSARLKNPLSDMLAKEGLSMLSANISKAVHIGSDLAARQEMLVGAMLAGQAFANAPVAAVHALAYPLGGNYHIPHGLSNSLVLPHVLRFNEPYAGSLYHQLVPSIFNCGKRSATKSQATAILAEYFFELAKDFGLPIALRDTGIPEHDLETLAEEAMLQTRLLINNPRDMEKSDALAIYRQAF
ncbi:MAG: iron-containing alcohol dehydrogenase [Cellvibrionales bacterium TMED148]|nr:alcohol dehydrogenase [Porticoccaceae bacterium]RPG91440.1 MAG: iron-containing alcohol dehydrogenase [Cellvibrionales bacterium TMED148]